MLARLPTQTRRSCPQRAGNGHRDASGANTCSPDYTVVPHECWSHCVLVLVFCEKRASRVVFLPTDRGVLRTRMLLIFPLRAVDPRYY